MMNAVSHAGDHPVGRQCAERPGNGDRGLQTFLKSPLSNDSKPPLRVARQSSRIAGELRNFVAFCAISERVG